MHEQLGSKSGLKRTGRRGRNPADPVPCGIMTQSPNHQNATDPTERWPSADAVAGVGGDVQEAQ